MNEPRFDQKDVDLIVAINVLSDQSRRVDARLAEIEDKLDDNAERLTRIEAVEKQQVKSLDRWWGWIAAVAIVVVEGILRVFAK